MTGELAETAANDAEQLLLNARQAIRRAEARAVDLYVHGDRDPEAGRRPGRLVRAVDDLGELLTATRTIVAQTRLRLAGHIPRRRDPDR